jgi:predicted metal-binding membrane protein
MKQILNRSSYQSALTNVVIAVSIVAAIGLWAWGASPLGYLLRHQAGTMRGWPDLLFVLGWLLMCVAMMLPTAVPLLAAVERLTAQQPSGFRLVMVATSGFLGVWLGAGILVRAGDIVLHGLMEQNAWLAANSSLVGATLLAIGGGYLLLPIAQQCVRECRSPMGFIARGWTGKPDVTIQSAKIGVEYGISCFGCCWPLMAVMCALGMSNPVWMLTFTLVMLLQKHNRYGLAITKASGLLLLAGSFVLLTGGLPSPHHNHHHHNH